MVTDSRSLHLAEGMNQVRFSWAGTRIDPTSLALAITQASAPVTIEQMRFPPDTKGIAIWHVRAEESCQAEIDITYFTSGLFWEPRYMAFLSPDRSRIRLTGYVRVQNRSGEDYDNARIRLVVGKIHLLDRISDLADRSYPYGRPETQFPDNRQQDAYARGKALLESAPKMAVQKSMAAPAPKKIEKTGLSEYYLYAIEGTQTIAQGWSSQLVSFDVPAVWAKTFYVYDAQRFGTRTVQMLTFKNDTASGLGKFPLPGGGIKIFHKIDQKGEMTFAGSAQTDYIPVGKKADLFLGTARRVKVAPRVAEFAKTNLVFDDQGNLSGFDDVRTMALDITNFSNQPAAFEITRHRPDPNFTITDIRGQDRFEKIDQTRFRFFVTLDPGAKRTIYYTLTTCKGDRKWQQTPVPSS
ncbi:MAG: hypothetical protein R6V15_16465, partial [Desulfotignum sp.]